MGDHSLTGAESIGAVLKVWHRWRMCGEGPEELAMAKIMRLLLDLGYIEVGGLWGHRFTSAGQRLYDDHMIKIACTGEGVMTVQGDVI